MTETEIKTAVNQIYLTINNGLLSFNAADRYDRCLDEQRNFHLKNAKADLHGAFNKALALQNALFYGQAPTSEPGDVAPTPTVPTQQSERLQRDWRELKDYLTELRRAQASGSNKDREHVLGHVLEMMTIYERLRRNPSERDAFEAEERARITSKAALYYLDRNRPYNGQPHTDQGERGKTELQGLTYRDVHDCVLLGMFLASGLTMSEWPNSVYDLSLGEMDPVAIAQNVSCELERRQGIYPNVPPLVWADGSAPDEERA